MNKYNIKNLIVESQFSVFKMKKANFDDIWETNFLLCCMPILTEAIKFLNKLVIKTIIIEIHQISFLLKGKR